MISLSKQNQINTNIMRNPQITTKLNRMMEQERADKIEIIGCILDNYAITKPNTDLNEAFNTLYDLYLYELNDILSDLISENYHRLLVMEACKSLKNN